MKRTVGIIGAGTMGGGIAQVAALAGFEVLLHDVSAEALKACMERIKGDLRASMKKGKATASDATEALTRITTPPRIQRPGCRGHRDRSRGGGPCGQEGDIQRP